jgi:hypothetical protein
VLDKIMKALGLLPETLGVADSDQVTSRFLGAHVMRYLERFALTLLSAAVLVGCGVDSAAIPSSPAMPGHALSVARPSSPLAGETLSSAHATSECSSGSSYSISGTFHVSGKARGPFPGTFTARGQVNVSIRTLSFSEHFQIRSASRTISGSASAPPSSGSPTFACSKSGKLGFTVEQLVYRVKKVFRARGSAEADLSGGSFKESFQ